MVQYFCTCFYNLLRVHVHLCFLDGQGHFPDTLHRFAERAAYFCISSCIGLTSSFQVHKKKK